MDCLEWVYSNIDEAGLYICDRYTRPDIAPNIDNYTVYKHYGKKENDTEICWNCRLPFDKQKVKPKKLKEYIIERTTKFGYDLEKIVTEENVVIKNKQDLINYNPEYNHDDDEPDYKIWEGKIIDQSDIIFSQEIQIMPNNHTEEDNDDLDDDGYPYSSPKKAKRAVKF